MNETAKVVVRSVLSLSTMGVALALTLRELEVPPWLAGVIGGQLLDWYYTVRS